MSKTKEDFKQEYGVSDDSYIEQAVQNINTLEYDKEDRVGKSLIGNLWDDLTGKNAQNREFAQQEYLQEKQWEYDSPVNQMKRMKEAGINPNLAAGGVAAGNQSAAAPSVPAGTNNVAAGVSAAAGAIDSIAGAGSKVVDAIVQGSKLSHEIENLDSSTWLNNNMGYLTDEQRKGLEIDNKYKDDLNQSELNVRNQQLDNMKRDWEYVGKQKEYLQKQLDSYDEQIKAELDLTKKRALEAEKHALEMEQHTALEKAETEFREKYKFSWFSNADTASFALWKECYDNGDFSEFIKFNDDYAHYLAERQKAIQKGINEANIENGYEASKSVAKGEQEAISEFGPANNVWRAIDKVIERKWPKPNENDTEFDKYQDHINRELKEVEQAIYDASNAKDHEAVRKLKEIREVLRSKKKGSYEKVLNKYK